MLHHRYIYGFQNKEGLYNSIMDNKTKGITIANYILSIIQFILFILAALGVLRYEYGCSGSHDNPLMGWYIMFGGAFLLIYLAVIGIVLVPVSIANLIISITILQHYGKKISAIISLIFSGIIIAVPALIFL